MESKTKRGISAFVWTFLGSILGFVFQMVSAKVLGASEYGKANVVIGLSGTYNVILNFGFTWLIVKESASSTEDENRIFSKFFYSYLLLDIVSFPIVFYILQINLSKVGMVNSLNITFAILLMYLTQIAALLSNFLIGIRKQHKDAFLNNFLTGLLKLSLFFALYIIVGSYVSYLLSLILTYVLIFLMFIKNIVPIKVTWKGLGHLLKNSWEFYLLNVVYSLYGSLSKYLQGLYVSTEVVAFLSLGLSLETIGTMLGNVLAKMAMPEFAAYWKKRDIASLDQLFKKVSRYNTYVMLPIVLFIVVNVKSLLGLLGRQYEDGTFIVSVLLVSSFFNSFVGPNGTLLNMSDKQGYEILNGLAGMVSGVALGILLGPKYEWGIAVSIAVSTLVVNLLKFIEVGTLHKIFPYTAKDLIHIFFWTITLLTSYKVISTFSNHFIWLVMNVLITSVGIFFMFLLSREREDKLFLLSTIKKAYYKIRRGSRSD